MKNLLFILSLSFLMLFSCSSGDDDSVDDSVEDLCAKFLECHEDSIWSVSFETESDYLIFLNNPDIIFKVYSTQNSDCYTIYNAADAYGSFPIDLIENTKDKLVYRIDDLDQLEYYRLETFTYANEIITYNIKVYHNNEIVENETQSLNKLTVDLNSLTICD